MLMLYKQLERSCLSRRLNWFSQCFLQIPRTEGVGHMQPPQILIIIHGGDQEVRWEPARKISFLLSGWQPRFSKLHFIKKKISTGSKARPRASQWLAAYDYYEMRIKIIFHLFGTLAFRLSKLDVLLMRLSLAGISVSEFCAMVQFNPAMSVRRSMERWLTPKRVLQLVFRA